MKMDVRLEDWQGSERKLDAPGMLDLALDLQADKIVIDAPDGRSFAIELQDGVLRVLAYEGENGKDAPVVLKSPPGGGIEIDRHDYDAEMMPSPEV